MTTALTFRFDCTIWSVIFIQGFKTEKSQYYAVFFLCVISLFAGVTVFIFYKPTVATKPSELTTVVSKPSEPATVTHPDQPQEPPQDNFLNIKVDGIQKKYFIREGYAFLSGDLWYLKFYSDRLNNNDCIFFYLPAAIASGDSVELTPQPHALMDNFYKGFSYTTQKGNIFLINGVKDGKILIKIDKWEGRGGSVIGSIEGTLVLNQVDKITFKDGNFKVRIQDKTY